MFLPPSRRLHLLFAVMFFAAVSAHAVIYTEAGDAGRVRSTAQPTAANQGAANQPLTQILGNYLSASDIDLFVINITDPSGFSATTVNTLTDNTGVDTALFLFDLNGRPVYTNDDDPSGTETGSTLPAGNALRPQTAGIYYLAISFSGALAVSGSNVDLFMMENDSTSVRGPNPNTTASLADWDTSAVLDFGTTFPSSYQIDLTGAMTAAVPEPSTWALLALGAVAVTTLTTRRRKQSSL